MGIFNFKIFESTKNMESEINSILFILNDEGFSARISRNNQLYKILTKYDQKTISKWLKGDERLEFLDRLKEIGYKYGFVAREKRESRDNNLIYNLNLSGKIIDRIRGSRKIFGKDSNKNFSISLSKDFQFHTTNTKEKDQILLLEHSSNFNIYLTNYKKDRLYIIVYSDDIFGGDTSKLKCISLCYKGYTEGEFIIFDNYGEEIGKSSGNKMNFNEIQTQLHLSDKSFKVFNDAWYYIEENYNEFKYPSQ